jgi:hypothetical protein
MLYDAFRARVPKRWVNALALPVVGALLLATPIRTSVADISSRMNDGAGGFNSRRWRESALVQYLTQHPPEQSTPSFSNAPDALYILMNVRARFSPLKTRYNSNDVVNTLPQAAVILSAHKSNYLVWFSSVHRTYLFSVDELKTIAKITAVERLSDGTLYAISTHE